MASSEAGQIDSGFKGLVEAVSEVGILPSREAG